MTIRILRLADVIEVTGLQKSAIYKLVKAGSFPHPVQLSPRATGWRSTDVEEWIASRPPAPLRPVIPKPAETRPAA